MFRKGFSLIEVNMAILIAAGGLLALFTLFPVGLRQSEMSSEDLYQATYASSIFQMLSGNIATISNIDDWNNPDEHPVPGPPINYPGGAPEFKQYVRTFSMDNYIIVPDGSMNFETISEFKRSLRWGAEIEFVWNNITYGVVRYGTNNKITIYQANRPETEKVCDTADDALEYMLGNDRLRDVVTQVKVVSRTI
jgi:type II secretory pathway pseudopilin PulG